MAILVKGESCRRCISCRHECILWEIGLRRYGFPKKVQVEIRTLKETDPRFLEVWPKMEKDGTVCRLDAAELIEEFQTELIL